MNRSSDGGLNVHWAGEWQTGLRKLFWERAVQICRATKPWVAKTALNVRPPLDLEASRLLAKLQCWNDRARQLTRSIKAEGPQSLRQSGWRRLVLIVHGAGIAHKTWRSGQVQAGFRFPLYYSPFFHHGRPGGVSHITWEEFERKSGTRGLDLSPTNELLIDGNFFDSVERVRNGSLSATKKDKLHHRFLWRFWKLWRHAGVHTGWFQLLCGQRQTWDG